ncbi:MAG: HAD family hydrolase [Thermomicrobiales bacterium]
MTWAVTLDFHNTIATCDDWFQIEVYDLIPAFFAWRAATAGVMTPQEVIDRGRNRYRQLRQEVMDSGNELDASAGIAAVLQSLGMAVDAAEVERALADIFNPTLETTTPVEGIVEAVRSLEASGVRLIVISSAAFHPFLEWTLAQFGIDECFEAILTSASTGHYKSTPRIYEKAVELLDIPAARCIHVGDSERFDVRPAACVGMNTVLFSQAGQHNCGESEADLCVQSLRDLPERLQTRFGIPLEI